MGEVNWNLGAQQGNPGDAFLQSFQQGQQRRKESDIDNALRALAANPDDEGAIKAYTQVDPRGGMEFQQRRQQNIHQKLEQHREDIVKGAQIFRQVGVKDEATYQQARQMAAQYGIDLSQVPPNFDPQYVQGVTKLADTFAPAKQDAQPNIAREVDYYRSIGRDDLAQQLLQHHAEGPPMMVDNGDGTKTLYPRSALTGGQAAPQAPQGAVPPPPPGFVIDGGPTPQASGGFLP